MSNLRLRHDDRLQQKLFKAISAGDVAFVDCLVEELDASTVLDMTLPGKTVLQAAVESGQVEMLRFLISLAPSHDVVNTPLWNGDTLLHLAIRDDAGMVPIVMSLLEHGSNPEHRDQNGLTALDKAVVFNFPDIAKAIVTHGNNPEKTARLANRVVSIARRDQLTEMATLMDDLLESFDQSDPEYGLYIAIINNNHSRITDLFLQHVDPYSVRFGQRRMSALHAAARQNDIRVMAMLIARLDRMGRLDAEDVNGQTPLHYAAARNIARNVDWLMFAGADPEKEDKMSKLPEELTSSTRVSDICKTCWDYIPDAIILMLGEWRQDLPRRTCTLSRSQRQVPDGVIPPVLLFRCTTEDDEDLMPSFEASSFEQQVTCLEMYEYRCSQPTAVLFMVDVSVYGYKAGCTSFCIHCLDHKYSRVGVVDMIVSEHKEASCEVDLLPRGSLVLVSRRLHDVVRAHVTEEQCVITDDQLQGFQLQVPSGSFRRPQELMIKAWNPLAKEEREDDTKVRNIQTFDNDISAIKNISCFYALKNSVNERCNKSLCMTIPMETTMENKVVSLVMTLPQQEHTEVEISDSDTVNHDGDVHNTDSDGGDSGACPEEADCGDRQQVWQAEPTRDADSASSPSQPAEAATWADAEGAERVWKMAGEVEVNKEQTEVRTSIRNMGVVVAAEVPFDMKEDQIISAIHKIYMRHNKKEILIFGMFKPYPRNRVEVMMCCVCGDSYDDTIGKLMGEGYQLVRQPFVSYAFNREVFLLQLQGNFKDMYSDDGPVLLEYQLGGRLNHTTFVLEVDDPNQPAEGVITVTRKTTGKGQGRDVRHVLLELTSFFGQRMSQVSASAIGFKTIDQLVHDLSLVLKTDIMKVYCHALGMTKAEMKYMCTPKGNSLSPSEKNLRMLSLTRSQYRSEPAFLSHLRDVLEKHRDEEALRLLNSHLGSPRAVNSHLGSPRADGRSFSFPDFVQELPTKTEH